jgi:hypothetical protein
MGTRSTASGKLQRKSKQISYSIYFSRKSSLLGYNVEKYSKARHTTDDNKKRHAG